jgi:hypothetical protein
MRIMIPAILKLAQRGPTGNPGQCARRLAAAACSDAPAIAETGQRAPESLLTNEPVILVFAPDGKTGPPGQNARRRVEVGLKKSSENVSMVTLGNEGASGVLL